MFKVSKGYNTITTTIRIPENIYQQLSALAVENKLSLNKLIIQCLEYSLDNLEENENNFHKLNYEQNFKNTKL